MTPEYDGPAKDMPSTLLAINRTCGFLVEVTPSEVRLVRDVTDEDGTVRWPYAIPRQLIEEIRYHSTLASDAPCAAQERSVDGLSEI